jgi:hypothetical protein
MSETDILEALNVGKCPDCGSNKLRSGLRVDIAEHLTCVTCEARFYVAPRRPLATAFIRQ